MCFIYQSHGNIYEKKKLTDKILGMDSSILTTIRSDGMWVELTWSIKRQIFLEIKAATYNL
jgi:hypothetical protein